MKEVILLTGPPLNGRDEYITEALKLAEGGRATPITTSLTTSGKSGRSWGG